MRSNAPLLFGGAILLAVAAALLAPDTAPPPPPQATAGGELPEGHPPIGPDDVAALAAADGPVAVVQETLNAGGYTYARVVSDGAEIWVAGPETPLSQGDEITLGGAMGMENFDAPSLGRTFESILFVNRFMKPLPVSDENRGTVLEASVAAGYSYILVERADGSGQLWIATMATRVEEGQTLVWGEGMVMEDFESPTLEKTFDAILFVGGVRIENEG